MYETNLDPKLKFYGGSVDVFQIHVTVLEFHEWVEFHPMNTYASRGRETQCSHGATAQFVTRQQC